MATDGGRGTGPGGEAVGGSGGGSADSGIDPAIRPVLQAALLTDGGAVGPALAMTALDRDTALLLLSDLEDAGLIRMGPGAVTWVSRAAADEVWADVGPAELAALHRGLAAALPAGSEAALRHEAVGAEVHDEGLADRLGDRARERLVRMGASAAAELATMAARVTPPDRRAPRLVLAGRFAAAAGQLAVADRLLGEAARTEPDPLVRARTVAARSRLWIIDGRMAEADRALAEASADVAAIDRLLAAVLDTDRVFALCLLGRPAEALGLARRADEVPAPSGAVAPGAHGEPGGSDRTDDVDAVLAAAASVRALTGQDAATDPDVLAGLVQRLPEDPEPDPRRWVTAIGLAQALLLGGQPATAAEVLGRLIRVGRRTGAPTLTVLPLTMLAEASVRLGRWDLAGRQLRDARRAEMRMRGRPWVVHVLALPSRMAAARGDVAAAKAQQAEAHAGQVEPLPGMAVLLDAADGTAALAAGEPAVALESFGRVDGFLDEHGHTSPELSRHHLDHVAAALEVGATATAGEVVQRLALAAGTVRSPWPGTILPGLRGMVEGDVEAVASAAGELRGVGAWDAARLHLWAVEQAPGHPDAPGWAAQAVEGFRVLQAPRWQRRAVAALDRPTATVTLTDRQRQIVEGVQAGRTNAQIADDLGLRPQTVANHLSTIYRLVGVRSRTELARHR